MSGIGLAWAQYKDRPKVLEEVILLILVKGWS